MNTDNLIQLSFEQLNEIQRRINTAISEKQNQRVEDAVAEVLDLLAVKFSDVSLVNVLHEIAFRCEIQLEAIGSDECAFPIFPGSAGPKPAFETVGGTPNIQLLVERLKVTRNSVLQNEDSRLLWLTNGGTQKTSKLFGKDLAEVLQETLKRIERLENSEDEAIDEATLSAELEKVDQWAGLHLGIPLLHGTLTVISPFGARQSRAKENSRLSQRSPETASTNTPEITFPLSHRRGVQGYAAQ